jgi:hypothetical protein
LFEQAIRLISVGGLQLRTLDGASGRAGGAGCLTEYLYSNSRSVVRLVRKFSTGVSFLNILRRASICAVSAEKVDA